MEILKEKIQLTLGDGSEWELPYEPSSYDTDFNVAEFRFLQTEGAYIDRATMGVKKKDIVVYFLGENHLNDYKSFENSCRDSRYWVVVHPYDGKKNMQPLNISFKPTPMHTECTISLAETMTEEGIIINADFRSNIDELADTVNNSALDKADEIQESSSDLNAINESSETIFESLRNKISTQNVSNDYLSEVNSLKVSSTNAVDLMRSVQRQLLMPIEFIDDIKESVSFLEMQFQEIKDIITSSINAYEFLGASIISALCKGVVPDNISEYDNTNDIDQNVDKLVNVYNEYIETIQDDQQINAYVMNYELFFSLHQSVIFTINHLYDIAVNAPLIIQDVTNEDTNPIVLSHVYGMEMGDLFKLNNWSVNKSIFIPKETPFKYYIN